MEPITRSEQYLASILGEDVVLPIPQSRIEYYLNAIAQNGIAPSSAGLINYDPDANYPDGSIGKEMHTLDGDVDLLKSQISEVESGFPQKSASGSIITIADGADNMPVVSLTAQITPVQSGTGDPSPDNVRPISGFTGANIYQSGEDTSDPTVIPITFPIEAGTVYGGSLKLNQDGTADLTVDHEVSNLNTTLDARIVQYDYTTTRGGQSVTLHGAYFQYALWSNVTRIPGLCNMAYVSTENDPGLPHYMWFGVNSSLVFWIGILDVLDMTIDEFRTWVHENDLIIWRPLLTPVTYHIENVDLVKTLYGLNNIWADTGDIDLVYRADPATYTAEQIRIMLNAMVAPVEPTTTASKAYVVNEFLILDNVLYKVIANIANGGTITPNTNVSATTVGEQLTAILNS